VSDDIDQASERVRQAARLKKLFPDRHLEECLSWASEQSAEETESILLQMEGNPQIGGGP
jgi:hypothetical protein